MPPTTSTPDRQAAPTPARDTLTLGVLLLAPVLLVFPLSIFGETFGWVAGISLGWLAGLTLLWSSTSWDPGEKGMATLVWPNGIAMVALGCSLWQSTRTSVPAYDPNLTPRLNTAGVQ